MIRPSLVIINERPLNGRHQENCICSIEMHRGYRAYFIILQFIISSYAWESGRNPIGKALVRIQLCNYGDSVTLSWSDYSSECIEILVLYFCHTLTFYTEFRSTLYLTGLHFWAKDGRFHPPTNFMHWVSGIHVILHLTFHLVGSLTGPWSVLRKPDIQTQCSWQCCMTCCLAWNGLLV